MFDVKIASARGALLPLAERAGYIAGMSAPKKLPLQVFDPKQEITVVNRRLPHWSQAGTISFITWRTWDSIPAKVLADWRAERRHWLTLHGIDAASGDWQSQLQQLAPAHRQEFQRHFSDRWNEHLDACHGDCVLRRPEIAQIVAESLIHSDGDRYELTDFVIMPNHIHLMASFPGDDLMLRQCESWKHFTATKINRLLNRKGRFWQQDSFDHLVRSTQQFLYLRSYIAENPLRAKLQAGHWVHWSKEM
jgi:REP element-mobilizing transposase RayT